MKNTNPSEAHNNRLYYNWALYDNSDSFLEKYSIVIKGTLYDLGCGERPYESFFLNYCSKYIGVDWSDTMHNLKADIIADLNQPLPIGCGDADTIVSISVMEHLKEPQNFLNECHRILKPEGYLILQVPFMWHVHEAPHDYFRYTRFGLKYMLEKAGFAEINIEEQTGFWLNWFIKLNYQLIRIRYRSAWMRLLKPLIKYFIHKNQKIGVWLDKKWYPAEDETQGYYVTAMKSLIH